jgi:hypothetical protein
MKPLLYSAVAGAAITLLLPGCGGDNAPPPPPPPPALTSFVGAQGIEAAWADPNTMSFTMPSSGTYAGERQFQRGTVDPMSGLQLGMPAGVDIYEGSDGHVYVVDLASSTTPTAMQASTETVATVDALCTSTGIAGGASTYDYNGVFFAADLATPTNSTYVYRLPGPDGVCDTADDEIHAIKTGMGLTAAPLTAAAMPAATVYSSTGDITGFVGKSGVNLVIEDMNLANPVTVGTFPSTIMVAAPLPVGLVTGFETGRLFVVDGNIVHVDYTSGTTSAALFAIPGWTPTNDHLVVAASPTTLYFAVNVPASGVTPASSTIYAMPEDGSAGPTAISTLVGTVNQLEFPVNGSNVIAGVIGGGGTNFSILAWPAAGGASTTILATTSQNGGRFIATANDVYYTTWLETVAGAATTRTGTTSGITDMTGMAVVAPVADSMFATGAEADVFVGGDTTTRATQLVTVFQVQGLSAVTVTDPASGNVFTADGLQGGTLYSIDTSTNGTAATLGVFPPSQAVSLAGGTLRGIERVLFLQAVTPFSSQDPATRDLYLVNSQVSNSLQRATGNL